MNLQIVTTGNLVPTCGADLRHRPFPLDYFGQGLSINAIIRPNQPIDRTFGLVQTDVARALEYKNPHGAGESMNLIEDQDFSYERIVGVRGTHKTKVLTVKGLSKFLMRSDHKKAVEFQDMLASKASDLAHYGIAFRDQSAEQGLAKMSHGTDPAVLALLQQMYVGAQQNTQMMMQALVALQEGMANLTAAVLDSRGGGSALRPVSLGGTVGIRDLSIWGIVEHNRMVRKTYNMIGETFTKVEGRKPTSTEASSLASSTKAYCRAHDMKLEYFYHQGKRRIYYPEQAIRLVHRTKWSARNQVFAESQGDLFKKLGE